MEKEGVKNITGEFKMKNETKKEKFLNDIFDDWCNNSEADIQIYFEKIYDEITQKKDEEFDEFIKKLDWDKDDYDLIKSRVEQNFGVDVDRGLWEYVFNQVCLIFKKKKDELSGEKLK